MRERVLTAIQGHRRLFGYAGAVLLVFAANVVALLLDQQLGYARVSMIFLAAVLISAVRLGSGPAYLAAALGFVSYNFYLVEPRFTFGVESEDILILAVFLSVAMLTGGLAGRVRDEARRSRSRAQTTGILFQAGRDFAALGDEAAIAQRLTAGLAGAVQGEAVLVLDREVVAHGQGALPPELLAALQSCDVTGGHADWTDGWRLRALWSEDRRLGAAAWRPGDSDVDELDQSRLVHVLLDMGTSAIARARLGRVWAEVQAQERTESLQNALLSSISHDMRTPLAAILAAATSLKAFGGAFTPEVREDLVDTITDEAERLNAFVANLLSMTRLEAGALALQSGPFDVAEGLDRIHRRYQRRWGENRIALNLPSASLTAWGDPILFEQAFTNVLENALRFSPEGAWVEIEAEHDGDLIMINTIDRGAGVPDQELGLIFEKFYRSGAAKQNLQGAGLGLSIVKGLMTAMGGTASARRQARGPGLIVSLALPRAK
jgi:K+-sensing histidine kinase KdpD